MLVENEDIINYLLARNFIDPEWIIKSDLAIINLSRRNCNFNIVSNSGSSYFLKQQIKKGRTENSSVGSVAYEAKFYQACSQKLSNKEFYQYLPGYYGFDETKNVLIVESMKVLVTLGEYYSRRRRFSQLIARELGKAFARLHQISINEIDGVKEIIDFSKNAPWIFSLPQPDQWIYFNSSVANIEFVKVLQQSNELCQSIDELGKKWKSISLIHGDFKWDNCLVSLQHSPHSIPRIKIVDWELCCIGDPCWDLAAVFAEYLHSWIASIPLSPGSQPDQFLQHADVPLQKIQPATRSFWESYTRCMHTESDRISKSLIRAIKYTGIRLLQITFEELQNKITISNKEICTIQVAENILRSPVEAAVQLLGLSLPKHTSNEARLD
jgi:thiamine kinase-like enzyme